MNLALYYFFSLFLFVFFSFDAQASGQDEAPPRRCEIFNSAWCVDREVYRIEDRISGTRGYDRVWTLSGDFDPENVLVILEPYGCRAGTSDRFEVISVDSEFSWENKKWFKVDVALRQGDACNLRALLPLDGRAVTSWPYGTGLVLVRSCVRSGCVEGRNLGELKAHFSDVYLNSKADEGVTSSR